MPQNFRKSFFVPAVKGFSCEMICYRVKRSDLAELTAHFKEQTFMYLTSSHTVAFAWENGDLFEKKKITNGFELKQSLASIFSRLFSTASMPYFV